jgi:hypothetical protein
VFSFLKSLFGQSSASQPAANNAEANWTVSVRDNILQVENHLSGETTEIGLDQLAAVVIQTNDTGPAGLDIWWIFIGKDLKIACQYPQRANGEDAVRDWVMALPKFDYDEMIRAMGSTRNDSFVVWSWER